MARRRGIAASLAQMQRELARQQAAQVRATAAAQREAERARKAYERAKAADEKERQRLYLESRAADVEADNEALEQQIAELETLLAESLPVDDYLDFESLKTPPEITQFDPGPLAVPEPPPDAAAFSVPALGGVRKLLPGAKESHAAAVQQALLRYDAAVAAHAQREQERVAAWRKAYDEHEQRTSEAVAEAERANAEIDAFRAEFERCDPDAIVSYYQYVLQRSSPTGFLNGSDSPTSQSRSSWWSSTRFLRSASCRTS